MNPLHEMIKRLPPRLEFLIVIMWAFGLPIFSSILSIGASDIDKREYFNNAALISVVVMELVQSLFLIWFLRIRGWTLEKLGLSVTLRGTGLGLALLIVTYAVIYGVQASAQMLLPIDMPGAFRAYPGAAADLSLHLVFVASTVNGIYEEIFVAGYIISALTPVRGMWTAINVSTGIRLLYHLYQGPVGILAIVPMGLIFGYTYARTRLLWPLILAHILMDIIGLSLAASGHSP
jgi:membrane protease YdiL (CAAX protease family)